MFPGQIAVQHPRLYIAWGSSHAGLGFSAFRSFNLVKIVTPCSISFGFLADPWWDSEIEKLSTLYKDQIQVKRNEATAIGVHSIAPCETLKIGECLK